MISELGTASGGLLGGLLGQAGEVLSYPRRKLWSAIGLPESGAEMVSSIGNMLGANMDPSSTLARALGMGAEMVLDPLTLGGMALGSPAAKALAYPWQRGAQLNRALDAMDAGTLAALPNLAAAEGVANSARAMVPGAAADLARADLEGIAGGLMRTYKQATPEVQRMFLDSNLGVLNRMAPQELTVYGGKLPEGWRALPMPSRGGSWVGYPTEPPAGMGPLPQLTSDELSSLTSKWLTDPQWEQVFKAGGYPQLQPPKIAAGLVAQAREKMAELGLPGTQDLAHEMAINRGIGMIGRASGGRSTMADLIGSQATDLPGGMGAMSPKQFLSESPYHYGPTLKTLQNYVMAPDDWNIVAAGGLGGLLGGAYYYNQR